MIKEIRQEVSDIIEKLFTTIANEDYTSYILYIGRADIIHGLKAHVGTDCVIDYQLDRYYDETRETFYVHYLNRNYSKEGFNYDGESGIDDLSISVCITVLYYILILIVHFSKSMYKQFAKNNITSAHISKYQIFHPQLSSNLFSKHSLLLK